MAVLDSLKNNQYFAKQTFEEFLENKKKGKRAIFYNKPTKELALELFNENKKVHDEE